MYDFHYGFIKKNFVANLLLTDNVTNENNSKDVYEEFIKQKHLFDFSKHRPEFCDKTNEKVSC